MLGEAKNQSDQSQALRDVEERDRILVGSLAGALRPSFILGLRVWGRGACMHPMLAVMFSSRAVISRQLPAKPLELLEKGADVDRDE